MFFPIIILSTIDLKITKVISERNPSYKRTVAQAKQDLCVSEMYNYSRNKSYVDLASNDARIISNTYYLDNVLDWKGLCIEPQKKYISSYLDSRTCVLANLLISDEKHIKFAERKNGGFSGIVGYDNKEKEIEGVSIATSNGYSLKTILRLSEIPTTIDYFSLDIEGYEYNVMKTFPFDTYIINLMTVERPGENLHKLLMSRNMCVTHNGAKWIDIMYKNKSFNWPPVKTRNCMKHTLPPYIELSDMC